MTKIVARIQQVIDTCGPEKAVAMGNNLQFYSGKVYYIQDRSLSFFLRGGGWRHAGLHCCVRFSLAAVHGCLIVSFSLVADHRHQVHGLQQLWHVGSRQLNSCGGWAQWLHGMWNLPGSGIKPVSPAMQILPVCLYADNHSQSPALVSMLL